MASTSGALPPRLPVALELDAGPLGPMPPNRRKPFCGPRFVSTFPAWLRWSRSASFAPGGAIPTCGRCSTRRARWPSRPESSSASRPWRRRGQRSRGWQGDPDAVAAETDAAFELALERRAAAGDRGARVACAGARVSTTSFRTACREPYGLQLAGDCAGAAAAWDALGCPYEAALALADADEEEPLRQALEALQRLGARPAAAIVARRLRERGVRDVPRGPRPRTRKNAARLTARELEVLRAARRRAPQRGDRRAALPLPAHRRPPRLGDPAQAGRPEPRRGRRRGRPARRCSKIGSPPSQSR